MDKLTQRELDILFGCLSYSLKRLAYIIDDSKLSLEYVTLEISGHKYKVGIDMVKESALMDPVPVISIPCEVENA